MIKPSNKRIISCAITGSIHTPSMSEYLPITPDDIAENALDAAAEGAAIVHIHVRNPENGRPSSDLSLYKYVVDKIKSRNNDVIICLTTGGAIGMTDDERVAVVPEFKPELASMNAGSINWGLFPVLDKIKDFKYDWEPEVLKNSRNWIFQNTFKSMERMCGVMKEQGTKPELEVYDTGHLNNISYLLKTGLIEAPVSLQFVTGILGGITSTPYDIMTLHTTAERVLGTGNYNWSVIGAGKAEFPAAIQALMLGGHVRVGLEDNLYLRKGVLAKNNGELVSKMARIMDEFDFVPATPNEAREILGLGK